MSKKPMVFNAIDVGTSKVCAVMAQAGESGSLQVLGVGTVPSQGLRKGIVVNIDEAREVVREAKRKAEQASGLKLESAYVGITGNHILSVNARGAIAISRTDQMVKPRDMRRVLDSARSVSVSKERQLIHVITRDYALDGHQGISNPVGMAGFRLDVDTHMVTASSSVVRNTLKCIRGAGVEVEDVVLQPLASGEAVLRPDEREAGVILVDIGGGTADVAVFKEGNVWHTAVLPVAGYQVTHDIAIALSLPFELAESLKVKYASLLPPNGGQSEDASLPLENGHQILVQDLNNVVRSRVEEILSLVMAELPEENLEALAPAGVVLTGGTAKIPGIEGLAKQIFRLPARVGVPHQVYGLADILYDPAYATSVGLLLWGTKKNADEVQVGHSNLMFRWLHRADQVLPHIRRK